MSGAPRSDNSLRPILFQHMRDNAKEKGIFLDRLNGYYEHVHCLASLGSAQTIEKVAQLLKGELSFWWNNRSGMQTERLEWQDDYFGVSIGEWGLDAIRRYIDNQEHHRKKSVEDEYETFMKTYGFG